MTELTNALHDIRTIDETARRSQWVNRIHPLVKLFVTVFYMAMVVSFGKYDVMGLLGMSVYPLALFELGEVPLRRALYQLRLVLPLVCAVGLFNPVFDRLPVAMLFGRTVTGGMLSMCTLMLKGILTVLSSYLLITTTTIESLCYALRLVHVPKIIVTQILLAYRYLSVLLSEAGQVTQAYSLRAPGQKGVHFRVWGSLAGQLLLRSMDRADALYQSMCLRGYQGEIFYGRKRQFRASDFIYLIAWLAAITVFRIFPVFEIVGGLII